MKSQVVVKFQFIGITHPPTFSNKCVKAGSFTHLLAKSADKCVIKPFLHIFLSQEVDFTRVYGIVGCHRADIDDFRDLYLLGIQLEME